MNLLVIFITMGAVAHETVDYTSATIVLPGLIPSGPVAIVSQGFQVQVVAALQIVYAYGGTSPDFSSFELEYSYSRSFLLCYVRC